MSLRARIHGWRGWRPAVRQVQVDDDGRWRWQQRDGTWLATDPDRIALGPFGLWVYVAGPADAARVAPAAFSPTAAPALLSSAATVHSTPAAAPQAPTRTRVSVTLWRACVAAPAWRGLQVAARWRMATPVREQA